MQADASLSVVSWRQFIWCHWIKSGKI